jgi:hypothetical protein
VLDDALGLRREGQAGGSSRESDDNQVADQVAATGDDAAGGSGQGDAAPSRT